MSAPFRGGEPEPGVTIGHSKMLFAGARVRASGGEPAGAGLQPLVMLGFGAFRQRQSEAGAFLLRTGSGRGRRGGLDAVAAGEVQVDEPRLGAARMPCVRDRSALSAEPICLFHAITFILASGSARSLSVTGCLRDDQVMRRD